MQHVVAALCAGLSESYHTCLKHDVNLVPGTWYLIPGISYIRRGAACCALPDTAPVRRTEKKCRYACGTCTCIIPGSSTAAVP